MHLSAQNIPASPSPYAKDINSAQAPEGMPANAKPERFEELFSDVAQRRESRELSAETRATHPSSSRRERAQLPGKHAGVGADNNGRAKKAPGENISSEAMFALHAEPLRPELILTETSDYDGDGYGADAPAPVSAQPDPVVTADIPVSGDAEGLTRDVPLNEQVPLSDDRFVLESTTSESLEIPLAPEDPREPAVGEATEVIPDSPSPEAPVDPSADKTRSGEVIIPGAAKANDRAEFGLAIAKSASSRSAGNRAEPKAVAPADFAETADKPDETAGDPSEVRSKNFLTVEEESVAIRDKSLGTNVANSAAKMASSSTPQISDHLLSHDMSSTRVEKFGAYLPNSDFSAPEAQELSAAHEAVHAAMEVSERFTVANQRAVNLQFSVKGEELSVRVELHDGEVRTTFHTASDELHRALAQEWQVLAADNSARGQRFADPVFSGGPADFKNANSGGNPEHRGSAPDQFRENFGSAMRAIPRRAPASVDSTVVLSRPAVPSTALRLHTFA